MVEITVNEYKLKLLQTLTILLLVWSVISFLILNSKVNDARTYMNNMDLNKATKYDLNYLEDRVKGMENSNQKIYDQFSSKADSSWVREQINELSNQVYQRATTEWVKLTEKLTTNMGHGLVIIPKKDSKHSDLLFVETRKLK